MSSAPSKRFSDKEGARGSLRWPAGGVVNCPVSILYELLNSPATSAQG